MFRIYKNVTTQFVWVNPDDPVGMCEITTRYYFLGMNIWTTTKYE